MRKIIIKALDNGNYSVKGSNCYHVRFKMEVLNMEQAVIVAKGMETLLKFQTCDLCKEGNNE